MKFAILILALIVLPGAAAAPDPSRDPHQMHRLHQDSQAYIRLLEDPQRDSYQKPHEVLTALRRNSVKLADWVSDLRMYPQKMINVPLTPGLDWKTHAGLTAARQSVEAELDGRGRILIRASGTEPKLRLMVEAEDEALANVSAEKLAASLG